MMQKNISGESRSILKSYLPLVDFLGRLIGPHCEVVLHDLTVPERSVVAIANGHISGREVGAPLTDFALRMLKEKAHAAIDFLHEYEGALKSGGSVRSSTFFIKNGEGGLIGLLCFNVDMSGLQGLHKKLDDFICAYCNINGSAIRAAAQPFRQVQESETFSESVEDLMSTSINKALAAYNLPPDRLSLQEREEVVDTLNKKGFFQLRGAVESIAQTFGVSEATVYRYLKNVQKKGG